MVNTVAADALDSTVPRSSAATILMLWDRHTLVLHQEASQIPGLYHLSAEKWVQISFMFFIFI